MIRIVFLSLCATLLAAATPARAQGWLWDDDPPVYRTPRDRGWGYGPPSSYRAPPSRYLTPYGTPPGSRFYDEDEDQPRARPRREGSLGRIADGGARPSISPIAPEPVHFRSRYDAGTIIIDTAGRQLFLVTGTDSALRYPISVGREGFSWTGEEKISRIADWPDWHPPAEMRERDPRLPEKMTGGIRNPLGAKALYLGNTLYRIHGTNDARSIGRAQSSGCFRMLNGQVIDLARRVSVGSRVVVVHSLRAVEARAGRSG